jgi:hypothetical protein
MNIKPIAAPISQNQGQSQGQQDARSRAIAKMTQSTPVADPSNVSVEELSAIKAPSAPVEEPQAEPATETPKEPEKKSEDPLSSQYALLARREKALRAKAQQQEQQLRAREEALKAKEAEIAAKDQDYQSNYISKQKLKANTWEALSEAQVSYDEITQQLLDSQTPLDPRTQSLLTKMEAKISKLETELETGKKAQSDQQSQAYKAAVAQIETDVKALVETDPAFETIQATRSVKDVVELIELTYKEDGRLLSVEEAAQLVEDHLMGEIDKLTRIEKVKQRLNIPGQEKTVQAQSPAKPAQQQQTMKTLTNATSSTRQLSAKERAILAFKGQLKA